MLLISQMVLANDMFMVMWRGNRFCLSCPYFLASYIEWNIGIPIKECLVLFQNFLSFRTTGNITFNWLIDGRWYLKKTFTHCRIFLIEKLTKGTELAIDKKLIEV
jgi:hypothetical protein